MRNFRLMTFSLYFCVFFKLSKILIKCINFKREKYSAGSKMLLINLWKMILLSDISSDLLLRDESYHSLITPRLNVPMTFIHLCSAVFYEKINSLHIFSSTTPPVLKRYDNGFGKCKVKKSLIVSHEWTQSASRWLNLHT